MKRKIIIALILAIIGVATFFILSRSEPIASPAAPTAANQPEALSPDAASSSPERIAQPALEKTPTPLRLPSGFSIGVFAKNLPSARVMIFDADGNIWLSQTKEGIVSKINIKDGLWTGQKIMLSNLDNPHGLAFDPQDSHILYIAEETRISKTVLKDGVPGVLEKIIDLPGGGNHFTRTLGFGPDGRLYVSIGSTCNVCLEKDTQRAAIYSLNKNGDDYRPVAKGLRNSPFFVWSAKNQMMWATEMGRDLLGDDTPPDEINVIDTTSKSVLNFGWPICYGQNIHDTNFDKNTYFRNPCMEPFELASRIDLQAHSAPLGLAFVPDNSAWPQEYKNNLLVAFHGSWNRSVRTGYKVVRLILDDSGRKIAQEDFISGWLTDSGVSGRPVGLIFDQNGSLYVSDDKAGMIYKVSTP